MSSQIRSSARMYAYEPMLDNPQALDRLEVEFRWGNYGIRVQKFHHTSFAPGKAIQFHKHSNYEFHFIPRGKGKVILGNEPFPLHEGLMYLTGPGVMHYQEADTYETMDELCLHIDIEPLKDDLMEQSWGDRWERAEAEACIGQLEQLPLKPAGDQYRAMECFLTAYRAYQENQPGLFTVIKQSIIQILLRTTRAYASLPQPELPSRDMKHYRYQQAMQFIKDNYMAPLTLEVVAERVQISPRQLQRIFREQTGGTFSEYMEQIRLLHVCGELSDSDLTIDRIAYENGFSSANYLHYVFKRKFGMTPMQYRLNHRRQP